MTVTDTDQPVVDPAPEPEAIVETPAVVEPIVAAATEPNRVTMAIVAAADSGDPVLDDNGVALPQRWQAIATAEGVETGDGRMIAPGALGVRPLPLPLMFLNETPEWGHSGALAAGTMDRCDRDSDTGAILAGGSYDLGSEAGMEAARTCRDQIVRYVSVDLTEMSAEWVYTDWEMDDWGDMYPTDGYLLVTAANIGGITQCAIPAFYQATIVPEGVELDLSTLPERTSLDGPLELITASVGAFADLFPAPDLPPAEWFTDPHFDAPQSWPACQVTDDGRVFGHAALWDTPHIGYNVYNATKAPRSRSGYAYFLRGATMVADAEGAETSIRTGPLTMGVGHARETQTYSEAMAHYDDVRAGVADIAVGEDEYGIWFSGAIRPGVTNGQVRALRASGVSGDWREPKESYGLEFMALLAVNVPGFPTALAASAHHVESDPRPKVYINEGRPLALVAAGRPQRNSSGKVNALLHRIAELEAIVLPMRADQAKAALANLRSGVS